MKKVLIDTAGDIIVTDTQTDANYRGNILVSLREQMINAVIAGVPQVASCVFHSRSGNADSPGSGGVYINFLLDDGVSYMVFWFTGSLSTNLTEGNVYVFMSTTPNELGSGSAYSWSYARLNATNGLLPYSLSITAVYGKSYMRLMGINSGGSGYTLPHIYRMAPVGNPSIPVLWLYEHTSIRLFGASAAYATLGTTSLPVRARSSSDNPAIVKLSKVTLLSNNEVVGYLGANEGDIIMTSSLSSALRVTSLAGQEVQIDGVTYLVIVDSSSYSILSKSQI